MTACFSILAWRILWTEEPGRLQSMGSQGVRHDGNDLACVQVNQKLFVGQVAVSHAVGLLPGHPRSCGCSLSKGPPASLALDAAAAKSHQSCPTLCHPMDCSLPGSSVHGISQARGLEWVAIAFSV